MCLYTLFEKPLKAEKDIVVYKVLYLENGQYYAPVVNDTKKINYVYTKGLNRPYEPLNNISLSYVRLFYLKIKYRDGYKVHI